MLYNFTLNIIHTILSPPKKKKKIPLQPFLRPPLPFSFSRSWNIKVTFASNKIKHNINSHIYNI